MLAVVVIPGDHVDRHRERCEQRSQVGVLLRRGEVHEVAARDHELRRRVELDEPRDARAQQSGRVDAIHAGATRRGDMQVGDLCEDQFVLRDRFDSSRGVW